MSQVLAENNDTCPLFELMCAKYIASTDDQSESKRRSEGIKARKAELYSQALATKTFKCACCLCFSRIWNLSDQITPAKDLCTLPS